MNILRGRIVSEHFPKLLQGHHQEGEDYQSVDARYIFLSYNNEGLMSFDDIREVMSARGEYGCFEQKYNRFKADKESASRHIAADSTTEYVHYVVSLQ